MQQKLQTEALQQEFSENSLTKSEAAEKLKKFGFNEAVKLRNHNSLKQFLVLFAQPLAIILLIAAFISAMVFLSIGLNFFETARSQKAAEKLREKIVPKAIVKRDGNWQKIERREVVPDDLIRIVAGNVVPADTRLIEAKDLHVQEAALTGESLPVEKSVKPTADEKDNLVFLGTSVISGTAHAIVTATGEQTVFGDIAKRLALKPPETEFERGNREFGFLISRIVLFLVVFVFLINTLMHRNAFESLLFSIALAVGLTPEFLPMIT